MCRYSEMWYDEKRSLIDAEFETEDEDETYCVECGEVIECEIYWNDDDEPICKECHDRHYNEYYYDWLKENGKLKENLSNEKIPFA